MAPRLRSASGASASANSASAATPRTVSAAPSSSLNAGSSSCAGLPITTRSTRRRAAHHASPASWDLLPAEILTIIFSKLPFAVVSCRVIGVCRRWRDEALTSTTRISFGRSEPRPEQHAPNSLHTRALAVASRRRWPALHSLELPQYFADVSAGLVFGMSSRFGEAIRFLDATEARLSSHGLDLVLSRLPRLEALGLTDSAYTAVSVPTQATAAGAPGAPPAVCSIDAVATTIAAHCPKLQVLSIGHPDHIEALSLEAQLVLASACPRLTCLTAHGQLGLAEATLRSFTLLDSLEIAYASPPSFGTRAFAALEKICLHSIDGFTDDDLRLALCTTPALRELKLYGVDDVTGLGLAGAACPLLTRLALCNCIGLTDPGLASFAGAFPLTALVINETNLFDKYESPASMPEDAITGRGIASCAASFRKLVHLDVENDDEFLQVRVEHWKAIGRGCGSLRRVTACREACARVPRGCFQKETTIEVSTAGYPSWLVEWGWAFQNACAEL